jgi:hypothetical protein
MDPANFTITGTWRSVEDGQEFEAVARTNDKAKRVVAKATGHASFNNLDVLRTLLGVDGRATLEASVTGACRQLALVFPG